MGKQRILVAKRNGNKGENFWFSLIFDGFSFVCVSLSLFHIQSENPPNCGHSLEMTLFKKCTLCTRHRNASNRQIFNGHVLHGAHKRNKIHQIKRHFVARNCFRVLCYSVFFALCIINFQTLKHECGFFVVWCCCFREC